jgi:hypothetical protein
MKACLQQLCRDDKVAQGLIIVILGSVGVTLIIATTCHTCGRA